ncbi:hypothetical protein ACEUEC_10105 [Aeromonas veronii]
MDSKTRILFRSAIEAYVEELDNNLKPTDSYLPYDFDFIHNRKWYSLGEQMVKGELRELTNIMNRWCNDLQRWHAWNNVIRNYREDEVWTIRREFFESLVHHCLLEPSAVRDRHTFVATNAFHQIRLSNETGYKDFLEGDQKTPNEKPIFLSRKKKETRLRKIISIWSESKDFLESLEAINDISYRQATYDYRNRVNHTIGPRLGEGITQVVTRSVVQATDLIEQPDGTYLDEPIHGKISISYGFGGTPPIDLEEAWMSNLKQYQLALTCYNQYFKLLKSKVACIETVFSNNDVYSNVPE